jgi:DNA-binding NarL/FixJ family response regulator
MIRILLADDHDLMRRGIRDLLEEEPRLRFVERQAMARRQWNLRCA